MPTPVLSHSSARTVNQPVTQKPRPVVVAKKKRLVRRRGRAKGDLDSDDEVEREVRTDSDSEDDDLSSVDLPTDNSDTEPVFDDILSNRAHLPTPRNSMSPETAVQVDGSPLKNEVSSFFSPRGNWSDMVAEENANGSADLPVIEFSDFKGKVNAPNGPSRKHKKVAKVTRAARAQIRPSQPANDDIMSNSDHVDSLAPDQQRTHSPSRNSGHAARQAYQHRLETDPSYIPTIGNFWGHDDRLIDADLRSLSGWWRGRGRGRGSAVRGRGGFQGAPLNAGPECEDLAISLDDKLPPIDRPWTHDGFEDMKRKEEQRRALFKQQKASHHAGSSTGGGIMSTRLRREVSSTATARTVFPSVPATRPRFLMKPELMWTKQHEAFLYFDPSLKSRPGQDPGVRIKLPGLQSTVVRSPHSRTHVNSPAFDPPEGSEGGDRSFVVCLPKGAGRKEGKEHKGDLSSNEDVFAVRPFHLSRSDISSEPINPHVETQKLLVSLPSTPAEPQPTVISQLGQLTLEPHASDTERQAKTERAVLRKPSIEVDNEVLEDSSISEPSALALPTLQTTFTPPPQPPMSQPSPAFSSPYGYSAALPLGIAMNQQGMLYEVATGRAVYLQPAPLYNPRPLMHSYMAPPGIPFVPGHMPYHSSATSPDFLTHPPSHTPPVNGFIDPSTGTPIFSFPRQTSRIEIRAPTEEPGKPTKSATRISSGLRTTAPSFLPSRSSENLENGYHHTSNSDSGTLYENINGHAPVGDAGMMAYPTYQQPYYHMEPYGSQYMDMSQAGQYDIYNMDQGAVYY